MLQVYVFTTLRFYPYWKCMASCKTTVCCKTHAWLDEQQERVCLAGTRPWVSALQNPNQQQQQKSHVLSHPAVALLQQGFQVSRLNPFCLIWYLLTLFPLFSICKWVLLIYFWQFHTCAKRTMVMLTLSPSYFTSPPPWWPPFSQPVSSHSRVLPHGLQVLGQWSQLLCVRVAAAMSLPTDSILQHFPIPHLRLLRFSHSLFHMSPRFWKGWCRHPVRTECSACSQLWVIVLAVIH